MADVRIDCIDSIDEVTKFIQAFRVHAVFYWRLSQQGARSLSELVTNTASGCLVGSLLSPCAKHTFISTGIHHCYERMPVQPARRSRS